MAKIIDGRAIAEKLYQRISTHVSNFASEYGRRPGLAVLCVRHREDSLVYIQQKKKMAERVGITSKDFYFEANTTTDQHLIDLIEQLNDDEKVDSILVQLPLPDSFNSLKIIESIRPDKDVDGLTKPNVGWLTQHYRELMDPQHSYYKSQQYDGLNMACHDFVNLPCTPQAVWYLLQHTQQDLLPDSFQMEGANCVVIGRSRLVGMPIAHLLCGANGTVTICHTRTKNLERLVRGADVVVSAAGSPHLIRGDWISPGAVVIDVGINVVEQSREDVIVETDEEVVRKKKRRKIVGDVEFENARVMASAITPVPGGVGPMTIAMLLNNTVRAAKCREIRHAIGDEHVWVRNAL